MPWEALEDLETVVITHSRYLYTLIFKCFVFCKQETFNFTDALSSMYTLLDAEKISQLLSVSFLDVPYVD